MKEQQEQSVLALKASSYTEWEQPGDSGTFLMSGKEQIEDRRLKSEAFM